MRTRTPALDQRILDAAARLFGGSHFHEVRMEDIATESNVAKGTLYRYFEDKEELYMALLSRAAEQIKQRVHEAATRELNPVEKLASLVETILEFFLKQPYVFDLIQQVEASRGTNHPWQSARDAVIAEVGAVFREAESRRLFTVQDPEITALVLLGGVRAIIRFGPKLAPADMARRIVETVLHGAAEAAPRSR